MCKKCTLNATKNDEINIIGVKDEVTTLATFHQSDIKDFSFFFKKKSLAIKSRNQK